MPLDKVPVKVSFKKIQLPLNNPIKLNKLYPPQIALPLIVIFVIHLFILIPFLSHKVRGYKKNNNNNKTINITDKGKTEKKQKGTIEL